MQFGAHSQRKRQVRQGMDTNDLMLREIQWLRRHGRAWLAGAEDRDPPGRLSDWQRAALERQRYYARRAARRFPDPTRWLWTDRSLAQASDWWSAAWKASLVPRGITIVDACCGAGVDLVALAGSQRGAIGIDIDPVMVALSQANLEALETEAEVRCGAIESTQLPDRAWLHIDPDRRPEELRTDLADAFSPDWETVWRLVQQAEGAIVKVGPRTEFSPNAQRCIEASALRVWVGNEGECRQQLVLFGEAAEVAAARWPGDKKGQRICVLAEPAAEDRQAVETHAAVIPMIEPPPPADRACRYVFDLHRCLHAAQVAGKWAAVHGLTAISDEGGYYTADTALDTPWAQVFEVIDVLPWDDRRVRRALRQHGGGIIEVKARLLRLDASRWQKHLSQSEGQALTVLVTRLGQRVRAILARRA
ncbi:MAG: class I SAM-dependent methyltransferase [Planctomycetota bacterium]|nr:MAG: class I SAM-dependent methyltransferase [Planctomycetota bacterium]